jgi:TonB family protein
MSQTSEGALFSLSSRKYPPWKQFAFSFIAQSLAIILISWVGILHLDILVPPARDYHFIRLVDTPSTIDHGLVLPQLVEHLTLSQMETSVPKLLRIPPETIKPESQSVSAPPAVVMAADRNVVLQPAPVVLPRELKINTFSSGSSAAPTLASAPPLVQTGGFGDRHGLPAQENSGRVVTIAQLGSYDLPNGSGYGNGAGQSRGTPGIVASAGFGNGLAIGNRAVSSGSVQPSGFSDVHAEFESSPRPKAQKDSASDMLPVEILSKPVPAYTEAAKKLHVEGEVLLEVVFGSSGKLQVLHVVRGLGYGLDDEAIRAAQQIRFKPAQRDGQPTDASAILHVIFQIT